MSRKLTQKEVLKRFNEVHGDKYDYSLVEYKSAKDKVKIKCYLHGWFEQRPDDHSSGQGCNDCGKQKSISSRKITTKKFIEKAKSKHGNEYDYSKVIYENAKKVVSIICKVHGKYFKTPNKHLNGQGCPKCSEIKRINSRRKPQEQFLEEAKSKHGDEYDYSLVEYKNTNTNVLIKCKKDGHGIFPQTPSSHLNGGGCPDCRGAKISLSKTKTVEEFVEKAKVIHSEMNYGYQKVDYKSGRKDVIIVCPIHGDFYQTPSKHLSGQGCMDCGVISRSEKRKLDFNEFIERSNFKHNNFYGYEKVVYKNSKTGIVIICPEHGEFLQIPEVHMLGMGCQECGTIKAADQRRKPLEQFVEEANLVHSGKYNYHNVDYKNSITKVLITCQKHGDFPQPPQKHIDGQGCPKCKNKNEGRIAIILNKRGIVHRNHKIKNRYFDFYLPEYNLIIERDGEQHYSEPFRFGGSKVKTIEENHLVDLEKTKHAKSKGHKICRLPYWLNEEQEKIEIQNILKGQPTYPDVPDIEQAKTKPLPN